MYRYAFKRILDILFSASVLLTLLPLLLVIAIILYYEHSANPIFFQKRIGYKNNQFIIYKFRTMSIETLDIPSNQMNIKNIPIFSKLIRRLNLDELPQLVNIFFGEMTIVGPRPALPSQKNLIKLRNEKSLFQIKPGLTGYAQINAFDGMTDDLKVKYDSIYSKNITLINDLMIILKTFWYLLKKPPVY